MCNIHIHVATYVCISVNVRGDNDHSEPGDSMRVSEWMALETQPTTSFRHSMCIDMLTLVNVKGSMRQPLNENCKCAT